MNRRADSPSRIPAAACAAAAVAMVIAGCFAAATPAAAQTRRGEPPSKTQAKRPKQPSPASDFVKGWLSAAPGGRLESLPAGARVVDTYGDRQFVEMPKDEIAGLAARKLVFDAVKDADVLSAGGERFDAAEGEPALDPAWRAAAPQPGARRPFLVKFEAPVKASWLADLQAAGAELVQYQSEFGYLLLVPEGFETRLGGIPHLAFHGEYHPAYKADASLRAKAARDEEITLRLVFFDLPGWDKEIDSLIAHGMRLGDINEAASTSQWSLLHYAILEGVHTKDLPSILRNPSVYWAEQWFPPQLEGERAAQITAGNYQNGVPLTGYSAWLAGLGADGSGVTVAVADTGLDTGNPATIHEDFTGRVAFATALCTNNRDRDGHGTNTASIALGDPRSPTGTNLKDASGFFWGMGAAPGAFLWDQKALDPTDCGTSYGAQANVLAQDAVTNGGASIGSHSFTDGSGGGGSYTSQAQAWDARVRDADTGAAGNQPYSVVFSAGNSGPNPGTLTSPKAAKNIITVGATMNYRPGVCPGVSGCGGEANDIDALVSFSSRGPTTDGRIKPDVVAPGHVIPGAISSQATYSCYCDGGGGAGCCASQAVDGSGKYSLYSGTSQAAPRVAGASAVVYDWYKTHYGSFPSPAMDKAILINGAVDMKTADVPNDDEGWGRVNLSRSLEGPPTVRLDQSTVLGTTGDPGAFNATYYVQNPTIPLKASLVWTDAPGAVNCNPCLVNDLDLLLTQGSTTWHGNNFTNGFSNTGSTPDTLNNIEGLNIAAGSLSCSSFAVKVRAQTLNGDGVPGNADTTDQDFALVVSNAATTPGPAAVTLTGSALSGGCDGDPYLDRRETADLTVDLLNQGCASGAGLEGVLSVDSAPPGAVVTVSPSGAQSLGTLAPGGATHPVWQVSLADDPSSFCGQKVRLRLDVTDSGSGAWTGYADLLLDADAFAPATNTDPATTDNSFSKDSEFNLDNCRVTSSPTSWHFGQSDCTGIVRDASTRDLIFAYTVGASDELTELSFQHAFNGYSNSNYNDAISVSIDPENDGTYVPLKSWKAGIDAPSSGMTLAGPFDLTPFNATHGTTVKIKFTFTGGAAWVGGPNNAAGWDIDDIVFKTNTLTCDAGSCSACSAPSGLTNNAASDAIDCQASGVDVSWAQDPVSWGDGGSGTRTYSVLRDGTPVASGGCAGPLSYATTACTDTAATAGVAHTYQVRYENGCASTASTTGVSATDLALAPPEVNDGTSGGNPVTISYSGGTITLAWDSQICAVRYNLYAGTVGGYWNHAIFSASGLDGADSCAEPGTSVSFADPGGNLYFLISADNGTLESNLGAATSGTRPYASPACDPH